MKEGNPPFYRSKRTKMTGLNRVKVRKCLFESATHCSMKCPRFDMLALETYAGFVVAV